MPRGHRSRACEYCLLKRVLHFALLTILPDETDAQRGAAGGPEIATVELFYRQPKKYIKHCPPEGVLRTCTKDAGARCSGGEQGWAEKGRGKMLVQRGEIIVGAKKGEGQDVGAEV